MIFAVHAQLCSLILKLKSATCRWSLHYDSNNLVQPHVLLQALWYIDSHVVLQYLSDFGLHGRISRTGSKYSTSFFKGLCSERDHNKTIPRYLYREQVVYSAFLAKSRYDPMLVHSRRVCFANMKIRLIQYRLVYPSVVCISRFYSLLSISRWSHDGELILILINFYVLGIASGLWFNHDLFTFVFISLNI